MDSASPFSWQEAFRTYVKPEVLRMLFLGFSAGLPVLLIFGTLSLWLNEAGVDKSTVTFFSWAALGYSFKFVWAPLVDRLPLPFMTRTLGRRRAWLLLSQLSVMIAIGCIASIEPRGGTPLSVIALGAILLGFASATQDIVIDAYRIESGSVRLQPMMSSMYMAGYRLGMLVAGAGALYLVSYFGSDTEHYNYKAWRDTYYAMSLFAWVGIITTLVIREPEQKDYSDNYTGIDYLRFLVLFVLAVLAFVWVFRVTSHSATHYVGDIADFFGNHYLAVILVEASKMLVGFLVAAMVAYTLLKLGVANKALVKRAYVLPITDFFSRYKLRTALLLLALVGFYRISDIILGVIANLFYQDIGYSKIEIANISKTFGLLMTIIGGFAGGVLALRIGVMRLLFVGALLAAGTNLLFMLLAQVGHSSWLLYVVIAADNLAAGLALSAFIAFLSSMTSISFTAVQYAIFSSLMTLLPKIIGGYSGAIVDAMGYSNFFLMTTLMGVPVLLLVWFVGKYVYTDESLEQNKRALEGSGGDGKN